MNNRGIKNLLIVLILGAVICAIYNHFYGPRVGTMQTKTDKAVSTDITEVLEETIVNGEYVRKKGFDAELPDMTQSNAKHDYVVKGYFYENYAVPSEITCTKYEYKVAEQPTDIPDYLKGTYSESLIYPERDCFLYYVIKDYIQTHYGDIDIQSCQKAEMSKPFSNVCTVYFKYGADTRRLLILQTVEDLEAGTWSVYDGISTHRVEEDANAS